MDMKSVPPTTDIRTPTTTRRRPVPMEPALEATKMLTLTRRRRIQDAGETMVIITVCL